MKWLIVFVVAAFMLFFAILSMARLLEIRYKAVGRIMSVWRTTAIKLVISGATAAYAAADIATRFVTML